MGVDGNEIAELKVHEVKPDQSLFEFEDTKTGKSIRPFGPAAAALLAELLKDRKSGYVFPGETGEGFYQSTRKVWAEVIRIAKLPGVTPHTLRHRSDRRLRRAVRRWHSPGRSWVTRISGQPRSTRMCNTTRP